jgi:hypothetical protein
MYCAIGIIKSPVASFFLGAMMIVVVVETLVDRQWAWCGEGEMAERFARSGDTDRLCGQLLGGPIAYRFTLVRPFLEPVA